MAELAPVYRYYTADLLTNEVLAEIPFGGVSYERAIKGAGQFQGKIPVIEGTESMDLYESTLPGQTALYVVRNNVCVWGGIIWSRQYNIVDRVLSVSASEFTSYFYHRRIWKTWNHEFEAEILVKDGIASAQFNYGTTSALVAGSSVHLTFDPDRSDLYKYNGYYKVDSTPAPTTDKFYIDGAGSFTEIAYIERSGGVVTLTTKSAHGLTTGDDVDLFFEAGSPYNGSARISVVGGSTSKVFTYTQSGADIAKKAIYGEATRELPEGQYNRVTVSVRTDTYDYVRSLIDAVFTDFVGLDFPNTYIEPGLTYNYDVVKKQLGDGYATITTGLAHELAIGQAVQIEDLGPEFDGEYEVIDIPTDTSFVYYKSGTVTEETVAPNLAAVSKVAINKGIVTVTTTTPHEMTIGQRVTVETGITAYNSSSLLNGTFEITETPTDYTFKYDSGYASVSVPDYALSEPLAIPMAGAIQRNLVTNPSGETASGTDVVRTNLILNPNFETNTSNWIANGTGTTVTRDTSVFYEGTSSLYVQPKGLNHGTYSAAMPVTANFSYTASAWIKGTAGQNIRIAVYDYNSVGTNLSLNETITTATGEWQRINVTRTMASTAVTARVGVYTYSAEAADYYVDNVLFEYGPYLGHYFDGSTKSDNDDFTYAWSGTANASTSTQSASLVANTPNQNCWPIRSKDWDLDGLYSIRVIPNSQLFNDTHINFDLDAGLAAGKTYTVMGTSRLRGPQTGTLSTVGARQIVLVANAPSGNQVVKSTQAPNTAGVTSHRAKINVPADVTYLEFRWYNGASYGNGDVWWDNLLVIEGDYTGPYFDGSSISEDGYIYDWAAGADSSPSLRRPGFKVVRRELTSNVAKLTTDMANTLKVGDSMEVRNVQPTYVVTQMSYNATNQLATITTDEPHYLAPNDTISVVGLQDSSKVVKKTITRDSADSTGATKIVTFTTETGHNFLKGRNMNVDIVDTYTVTSKALSSNVGILKTSVPHSLPSGSKVTVSGVMDTYDVVSVSMKNNVATVALSGVHNFKENSVVNIYDIQDKETIISKEAKNGAVILTLSGTHNFKANDEVTISGLEAPFDGRVKILSVTDTRVFYTISDKYVADAKNDADKALATKVAAQKKVDEKRAALSTAQSQNDGSSWRVTAVTNAQTAYNDAVTELNTATSEHNRLSALYQQIITGFQDTPLRPADGLIRSKTSVFNGQHTVTSVPSTTKIKFALQGNDVATKTQSYSTKYVVTNRVATTESCTLTTDTDTDILVGEKIVVSGVGARYDGTYTVTAKDDTAKTVTYIKTGAVEASATSTGYIGITPELSGVSIFNGDWTLTSAGTPDAYTLKFSLTGNDISATAVTDNVRTGDPMPRVSQKSPHYGTRTITGVTRDTVSFKQTGVIECGLTGVDGTITANSLFNGSHTVSLVSEDTIQYSLNLTLNNNLVETKVSSLAFVSAPSVFNTTSIITAIDKAKNTVSYSAPHNGNMPVHEVLGLGYALVRPKVQVSTFGPFPGNADIGIGFSTANYSGKNVLPKLYRGFELTSVGDALSSYSDNIEGFEYRIDCSYDTETESFTRTFILIPIDFPNAPAVGEISPLSRFNADKVVFEYPGNINNVTLAESAENTSTRFFAVGENDLGPDAGPSFSVASAEDLLSGKKSGRKWPILDADEQIKDTDDETLLHAYAERYLSEARPPDASLTVQVNGSLHPVVGSYAPGDWCSLIVDDMFILQRLASDLEVRDNIIVRKIDSVKVSVPDGTTFPETVDLTLVPEWEVDKIGQ